MQSARSAQSVCRTVERNLVAFGILEQINPDCVNEIHVAGGHELAGFYTDAHSGVTPSEVWSWAYKYGPRLHNLRAIVFEFHESYFEKLGLRGIVAELERMHEWAEAMSPETQRQNVS